MDLNLTDDDNVFEDETNESEISNQMAREIHHKSEVKIGTYTVWVPFFLLKKKNWGKSEGFPLWVMRLGLWSIRVKDGIKSSHPTLYPITHSFCPINQLSFNCQSGKLMYLSKT